MNTSLAAQTLDSSVWRGYDIVYLDVSTVSSPVTTISIDDSYGSYLDFVPAYPYVSPLATGIYLQNAFGGSSVGTFNINSGCSLRLWNDISLNVDGRSDGRSNILNISAQIIEGGGGNYGVFVGGNGSGGIVALHNANNSYSGTTTVNNGVLQIDSDGCLGTGAVSIGAATLRLNAGISSSRSISLSDIASTIDTQGYAVTLSGAITGTGTLNKNGNGSLFLSGTNSYASGTTINNGIVVFSQNAVPTSHQITVNSAGAVAFGFSNIQSTLATYVASSSTGSLALVGDANHKNGEYLDFRSFPSLFLGSQGSLTVTYSATATFFPYYDSNSGLNVYRLGGGGNSLEFDPAISGNSRLIVGAGGNTATVILGNSATNNNYTGGTTITADTIRLGNANVLGSGDVSVSGIGTLDLYGQNIQSTTQRLTLSGIGNGAGAGALTNGNTNSAATWNGPVTLYGTGSNGTGAVPIDGAGQTTLAGPVDGPGILTKTGAGTLILSAANTYTGGTTVNNGTLTVNSTSNLGAISGALAVNNPNNTQAGTTVILNLNSSQTVGSLSGTIATPTSGTNIAKISLLNSASTILTDTQTTSTTFAGTLSGVGGLAMTGTGNLTLSGTSTYTGPTTISNGTLTLGKAMALPSATSILINNGGTLAMQGFNQSVANLSLQGGSVTGTTGVLSSTSNYDLQSGSIGAILDSSVGAVKSSSGTVVLSATNTYSGGTTIDGGVLSISNDRNLGSVPSSPITNLTFDSGIGGTLLATSSISLAANRTILLNAPATFDTQGSNTLTIPGLITGASTLTKTDTGTLTLSGTNTYTGSTTVTNGTLMLGLAKALPTSTSVVVNGGTLAIQSFSPTVAGVSLLSGSITGTTGVLSSTTNYDLQNGSVSAILDGTAGAVKSNSGTVVLSATNTYSGGTTIDGGVLSISSDANLGTAPSSPATNITFDAGIGGTLLATSSFALAAKRSIQLSAPATFDVQGSNTVTISGFITGASTLTKTDSGTLNLSGTNSYTGATTITGGTLNVNTSMSSTTYYFNGGTMALNVANALPSTSTVTLAGGTWNISSYNPAVGAVSLQTGGTINGSGSISSATTYDLENGTVNAHLDNPSTSVGVNKTSTGTVTLNATNTYGGSTTILSGTLALGITNALPTGTSVVVSGGTLSLQTFNQTVAGLSLQGGSITGDAANPGILTSTSTYDLRSGSVIAILDGASTGASKTTSGTVFLSCNNTYGGNTSITGGTLQIGHAHALGNGTVSVKGATLDLYGQTVINQTLTLDGTGSGSSDVLTNSSSSAATWQSSVVLTNNVNLGGTGDITLSGQVSGDGVLTKDGSDTLFLTGTKTGDGQVNVVNGTLQVACDLTTEPAFSSAVGINGQGTLSQTSGTSSYTGASLILGVYQNDIGVYNLKCNATLNVSGSLYVGGDGQSTFGTGTFKQSDTTAAKIYGTLSIGTSGTYALGGGTLQGSTVVNNGVFTQTGGMAAVRDVSGSGTFNLFGGTLSTGAISGTITFSAPGGALSVNGSINAGTFYASSGGSISTHGNVNHGTFSVTTAGTFWLDAGINNTNNLNLDTLTISGANALVQMPGSGGLLQVSALSIGTGGKLDLEGNDLLIHATGLTSAQSQQLYGQVEGWLYSGRNGGTWNGTGISSSTAQANYGLGAMTGAEYISCTGSHIFDGQTVSPNDIVVKYTLEGDANFDGKVSAADYLALDVGYLFGLSGWSHGRAIACSISSASDDL